MGYAAVQHVPRLFNHAAAKRQFDRTQPIRGTTTRPLGRRRDHAMYSIRENEAGHIELVCYRTTVVTYEQGGAVRVKIDGWNSMSTRQFIRQTLGIATSAKGDYCILEIQGGKYTLKKEEELLMVKEAGYEHSSGGWVVLNAYPRLSYRINRKGANNVRATYKPFTDYLKSFVALRSIDVSMPGIWGRPACEYKSLSLSLGELGDAFGVQDQDGEVFARVLRSGRPDAVVGLVTRTVTLPGVHALKQKQAKDHESRAEELLELVKSGDHTKFYKAVLWLCSTGGDLRLAYDEVKASNDSLRVAPDLPAKVFDEFILRRHAQETIEVYPTPKGEVPGEKYKEWV